MILNPLTLCLSLLERIESESTMIDMNYKRCSICKASRPVTDYSKHSSTYDGLFARCIQCAKLLRAKMTTPAYTYQDDIAYQDEVKARQQYIEDHKPFIYHNHLIKELLDCMLENPGSTPRALYWKIYNDRSYKTPPNYVGKYLTDLEEKQLLCNHGGKYYLSPALEKGYIASKQKPHFRDESAEPIQEEQTQNNSTFNPADLGLDVDSPVDSLVDDN